MPGAFATREGRPYTPQNYDRTYHGPLALREALATSSNVATVRVLDAIGVPALLDMAERLGISTLSEERGRYGLSLTLGGGEVTPLELLAAYRALALHKLRNDLPVSSAAPVFSGLERSVQYGMAHSQAAPSGGIAFAGAGVLYPFFGTLLGWLGVALTGSDTASNILFGNLQKITSEQLGLSPILMGAANSSGGVMGKMIDAQSIVVASTATNWYGHEGTILRFVFGHSIALACLVGILVMLQAYVFTGMIVTP